MKAKRLAILSSLLVAGTVLTAGPLRADDHEEARRLRETGDILSLEQVIAKIRQTHPGRIIDSELDDEDGRYVYELEVLDDSGKVSELKLDARTGEPVRSGDREPETRSGKGGGDVAGSDRERTGSEAKGD
jgi:uncharacterized iron-regulated membrane protein